MQDEEEGRFEYFVSIPVEARLGKVEATWLFEVSLDAMKAFFFFLKFKFASSSV